MTRRFTTAQLQLAGFIIVLAICNVAYRLIYASGVEQSAALYIGVPALLAVGLALLPRSQSATGMIFKGSMIAVLLACVLLPEGLLCLLFAVPLVLLVGAIVGTAIDAGRRRNRRQGPTLMFVGLPLLLLSFEGIVGSPFDNHDAVEASITVEADAAAVARALASTPQFDRELPVFLTIGFNRPTSATGAGLAVGDQRTIEFAGGTHDDHPLRLFGLTGQRSVDHHAQMHLSVVESNIRADHGRVVFDIEHDATMLSRWLDLDRAVVTWQEIAAGRTRVTWRLEYRRLLYPTFYFGPLQRFGMSEAAGYLLEAVVVDGLR